ncbi:alpha-amylase [Monocercomonoides exilis]|uniref:alpha-amylase n=1 Tax=Monocercomonoides exilis TaxID=2049356 RepID=UPI003559D8D2|nr:alpha-amylase [Monocercomonoides exilis]|eukprot:MONOS_9760.1-p1 / transcript=MONOS_9760.1 / gene=MONOS_9760 / organism=Monocercomonoides_exilis_PA203 / gene_product=alpha-amylase / transcript_product=alpha-amylase / location=Mono_scaffold00415:47398-48835(+) / protein_length=424 / sequence_SO=supercontig / SO=protein_coding / is_pseudo=false
MIKNRFSLSNNQSVSCDLHDYCGGTWEGIEKHLDYIKDLGANAIWISPIVANPPKNYHGYAATDFYALNTHFGNSSSLKHLVNACKQKDIWVMVDLVFNHVAVGDDVSKISPFNKPEHYHDKCDIYHWDNQWEVENCRLSNMPDLKHENPWVRDELIRWCKWIINEYSLDGIRIDTIKHVPKDFWAELVKSVPNVYMLGEVFDGNVDYLKGYTRIMPGQLSYPMYYTLMNVYAYGQSCYQLRQRFNEYANAGVDVSLLGGFIDNHDNKRWLNINGDWKSLKNALAFNILGGSIPLIYYGTEQGFNGGDDPNNREPMWKAGWNKNHELYRFISVASKQRQKISPKESHVERYVDDVFYAFSRGKTLVCTTNKYDDIISRNVTYLPFKQGEKVRELYSGATQTVSEHGLSVKIYKGQPQIWVSSS